MTKGYPTREEAEKIWQIGIDHHLAKPYGFNHVEDYKLHSRRVGEAAEKIAKYIPEMDAEKAFILGLLHDYGKRLDEFREGIFHGQEGYEEMMKMNYPDCARICLSHTFPNKDFDDDEFAFSQSWKDWARQTLASIEYDDYDRLIMMCDKLHDGGDLLPMEKRIERIVNRYNLPENQEKLLLEQCSSLKNYFDNKTNNDIYKILGIQD